MLITPKRSKLLTSNFTRMFPETVRTGSLIFFEKGAGPWSRDPLNFSSLNTINSKTVKAADFKFYANVSRDSKDVTP